MQIDLAGRVRNTPLVYSKALFPVFEAVVNSIHAIHEARAAGQLQSDHGAIRIRLERDNSQPRMKADDGDHIVLNPVQHIAITDDGVGFTDVHFRSFCTSDTTQKLNLGGRGIGRLLWLKAFDHAEVESTFADGVGRSRRLFEFRLSSFGVERERRESAASDTPVATTVRLCGMKEQYRNHFPRQPQAIGRRLIEHCLQYFVVGDTPQIVIEDAGCSDPVNLNEMFVTDLRPHTAVKEFEVDGQPLSITHMMIAARHGIGHRLHFCANRRVVRSEPLERHIAALDSPLSEPGNGQQVVYAGCVAGASLDLAVSADRAEFQIPERRSDLLPTDASIAWDELLGESVKQVQNHLAPMIEPIQQANSERIRRYVYEEAPRYRPLIHHRPAAVATIPVNLSKDRLDMELYRRQQAYEVDLRTTARDVMAVLEGHGADVDLGAHEQQVQHFLEEWNEFGIAQLAEYVAHRRATLNFLQATLRRRPDGKYSLESAVHQIVFPLRSTSDDVRWDQMNLWMVDEKLAYHYYLASDRRFEQMAPVVIDSDDRPDIIIFDNPAAFVDTDPPFGAITLIEFKRPGRTTYSDDENPINQVYGYVNKVREGRALDHHGRPIAVAPDTRFYAYIICDLTPTIRTHALAANLSAMPDGQGFFGYNTGYRVYVELFSFEKLIGDAQRRNQILFDKLENSVPTA